MSCKYSRKSSPVLSDLAMIWDSENSAWKVSSFNNVFNLFSESFTSAVTEAESYVSAPTAGSDVTVSVTDEDIHLILTPSGTLATLTITLPDASNLRDKQILLVTSTQIITDLTVTATGSSINGSPDSMTAGGYFTLKYDLTLGTWNRIG